MATVSRRALCAGRKVLCDEIRRDIASAMSDEPEEVDSLLHDWLDEHPEIQYGDLMRP
jgi:hypothetical protein